MADWAGVASFTGVWQLGKSISLTMDSFTFGPATGEVNRNTIIANEQVQAPQTSLVNLLSLTYTCGGANATGSFNCLKTFINMSAPTANTQANYVSATFAAAATSPDGGLPGAPRGSLFGANVNARLAGLVGPNGTVTNSATNWLALIGEEIDVYVDINSSVSDKIGHCVVQIKPDAVAGSRSNLGYSLVNQFDAGLGVSGWDVGFCFGGFSGFNPIAPSGTLIGTCQHGVSKGYGVPGSMGVVTYGVDLTGYAFQGAPFVAQLQTPASSSAPGKTGSICWDNGFIYICTATNTWKRATLASF